MARGHQASRPLRAHLLAGVSLAALALPAAAAELSPGGGAPWVLDVPGTYTITGADTSAEDAWIGLDTPGVILAIDGTTGAASLTIASGKSFHLGINSTASGEITTLTGSSIVNTATLASGDQVFVGEGSADNTLTLNAFSSVTGTSVVVGVNSGADGNLMQLLTSTSAVTLSSNLIVGYSGDDNSVTLANGATLDATGQAILGYNAGSDGNSLTLSTGASLTADLETKVGYSGANNTLTVQSGASFTTYTTQVGQQSGADGNSVVVTGAGTTYTGTTNASFNVGDSGKNNSLMVADGAHVSFGDRLALGKTVASTGNTVTVTGTGSELHAGNIRIGITTIGSSGNSLVVVDGGYVSVASDIKVRSGNSISVGSGARLDMLGFTADSGATFAVDVDASRPIDFDVDGTAVLGGTLDVNWTGGALTKRYHLLTADTVSGTFGTVDTASFAPGIGVTADYLTGGVDLVLDAELGGPDLGGNQQGFADAVNAAFDAGAELSGGFVPLYGIADPDLDAALSHLTGEINAYAQTGLGWAGTEAALGLAGGSGACAPEATGAFCATAFLTGRSAQLSGDADAGSHDTTDRGLTLGVLSNTRVGADTLFGGVVAIDSAHAAIDGLGSADMTSVRLGGSLRQDWQGVYALFAGVGGFGLGETSRTLPEEAPGTAAADLSQAYIGLRAELGAALPISDALALSPFGAIDWVSTSTAAFSETVTGDNDAFGLGYSDGSHARSSTELGLRLLGAPSDNGVSFGGKLAWRHTISAETAVTTEMSGLPGESFEVTPAAAPADLLLVSGDLDVAVSDGASFGVSLDGAMADGYNSIGGKLSLTGRW